MNQKKLQTYCQSLSKLKPDLVVLGGDIVDEKTSYQQMQEAFETLALIESRFGTYYVYGNHDQARYQKNPSFTAIELKETIEKNNIVILEDKHISIQNELSLVGRANKQVQRLTSNELLKGTQQKDYLILLDYQPVDLKSNDRLGYDLQLSGHTHGGQMFLVCWLVETIGFGEMNYGYRHFENMSVIVTSGMAGWGYPLRVGSHSEYVVINIEHSS